MNLLKSLFGQAQLITKIPGVSVEGCCFIPSGNIFAVSLAGGEIRLIDITQGTIIKTLDGKVPEPGRITATMNGSHLAVIDCARDGTGDGEKAEIWDINTGQCILATELNEKSTSIALSTDCTILAVGRRYDTVIDLYAIPTGELIKTLSGHGTTLVQSPLFRGSGTVQDLAFFALGPYLVSGADDGQAILWNIETGKGFVVAKHDYIVKSVCVSPFSDKVATGGSESWLAEGRPNLVNVAEVRIEGTIKTLLDHFGIKAEDPVKALSFDKHGALILAACDDDTLWLWPGKGDAKPIKHNFGKILALSKDATKIAAERDETLAIWDISPLVK